MRRLNTFCGERGGVLPVYVSLPGARRRRWTGFFRNLLGRNLRMPTSVTSDGALGLIKAIEAVFARSIRMRCWFHRLANIRSKLRDDEAAEVMAHLYAVRDAPAPGAARRGGRSPL